jgi:hypothetical protein
MIPARSTTNAARRVLKRVCERAKAASDAATTVSAVVRIDVMKLFAYQ